MVGGNVWLWRGEVRMLYRWSEYLVKESQSEVMKMFSQLASHFLLV